MYRSGLFNFSKGELAPALYGRIDVQAYSAGLRRAENVRVLKYGGIARRMGMRVVYETIEPAEGWDAPTSRARLLPFEFSLEQSYALLFRQAKMNVFAGGAAVIETLLTITAATNTNPVRITSAFHGLANGDEVFFAGVLGMVELNDLVLRATVVDANRFDVSVDGRAFGVFTGDTGGIVRTEPPPPPEVPPTVPDPIPAPIPPTTTPPGGGGGGGGGIPGENCLVDTTEVLMADRSRIALRDLRVGMRVQTLPELEDGTLGAPGAFEVTALSFAEEDVVSAFVLGVPLRGTPDHRVWMEGRWVTLADLGGIPDGRARVAKVTVAGAHTYIAAGILSHNIKVGEQYQ